MNVKYIISMFTTKHEKDVKLYFIIQYREEKIVNSIFATHHFRLRVKFIMRKTHT